VGQKLGRLDSPDRVFNDLAEFLASFVRDGGLKILNLDQPFADEYNLCDFPFDVFSGACFLGVFEIQSNTKYNYIIP